MSIKNNHGFTLVEILVSITIMLIVTLGLTGMQSSFGKSVNSRKINTILNDVANNQLNRCKVGQNLDSPSDYAFENSNANIKKIKIYTTIISGTCAIPTTANTCNDIILTSTDANISSLSGTQLTNLLNKSRKVTVQSIICNFN